MLTSDSFFQNDHERLLSLPHGATDGGHVRVRRLRWQFDHPSSGEMKGSGGGGGGRAMEILAAFAPSGMRDI